VAETDHFQQQAQPLKHCRELSELAPIRIRVQAP
jgi:hypothetical protein